MHDAESERLTRAAAGDRQALGELLERHSAELHSRLASSMPTRWQAVVSVEDILQETYTDAFIDIRSFVPRGDGAFGAWLWTLARRNLLDVIRLLEAKKRGGTPPRGGADEDSFAQLLEQLASITTPSRNAAGNEARSALEQALARLPEHYRRIIHLYDLEGKTLADIGHILQRKPATLCIMRARALRHLQQAMGHASDFFSGTG